MLKTFFFFSWNLTRVIIIYNSIYTCDIHRLSITKSMMPWIVFLDLLIFLLHLEDKTFITPYFVAYRYSLGSYKLVCPKCSHIYLSRKYLLAFLAFCFITLLKWLYGLNLDIICQLDLYVFWLYYIAYLLDLKTLACLISLIYILHAR